MTKLASIASRRVLVVDDNREVADMHAALLRLCGHSVITAYDGPTALRLADGLKPEVVFLDLMMPRMDGITVARCLRELSHGGDIKIVAISAVTHLMLERPVDFDCCIHKPATADDLAEALAP